MQLDHAPGRGFDLLLAHRFAAAATASLLVAGAFIGAVFSATDSRAQGASGGCEDAAELAVLPSPLTPWKGAPLRVLVASEKAILWGTPAEHRQRLADIAEQQGQAA